MTLHMITAKETNSEAARLSQMVGYTPEGEAVLEVTTSERCVRLVLSDADLVSFLSVLAGRSATQHQAVKEQTMNRCYWCREANPNLYPMRVTDAAGQTEMVEACANCSPQCVHLTGFTQCTEPQHSDSFWCKAHALEAAKVCLRVAVAERDWDIAESWREDIVKYGGQVAELAKFGRAA